VVEHSRDITEQAQAEEALKESEQRFRDIADNLAEWVWEVDLEGKLTYSSPAVEQLLGYKLETVLGQQYFDFFHPDERQELKEQALALFVTKQNFRDFISPNLHKNGEIVWLSTSGVAVLDAQGNFLGYRGANVDITERRKSQEALEIANTQLKALLEDADERNRNMALLNDMVDVLQSCRTSAEAFEAIGHFVPQFFPIDAGALYLLRNSKNLLSPVTVWGQPPPSEEMFPPDDCWAIRGGRVHQVDDPDSALLCKHVPLTGTLATGYLCVPLMAQGTSLGIFHIRFLSCATGGREAGQLEAKQRLAVAIAENLSLALANLKLRESLQNQAIHDTLTGLFNRRYLEETMDQELHRARRQKLNWGGDDGPDHLKTSMTPSAAAGDALLSALANVITTGIRAEDIACRYGGEKFLLIMPGASSPAVLERAENLRQAAKTLQVKYQNQLLKSTTISLGVAIFPDHGLTADEVIAPRRRPLPRQKAGGIGWRSPASNPRRPRRRAMPFRPHTRGLPQISRTESCMKRLDAALLMMATVSQPRAVPPTATTSSPSGMRPASTASMTISQATLIPCPRRRKVLAMSRVGALPLNWSARLVSREWVRMVALSTLPPRRVISW
jgi:diguanylate cyclase (GGDEF)-like protein/PAS domain S-box-containing protein